MTANPPGVPFVNVRFAVSLILIAVGALTALMGAFALLNPNGNMVIGFRLGYGGVGAVGVLMVLFGLRLRNRAVAESPALKQQLEGDAVTRVTVVAKPSFLMDQPAAEPEPPEPPPKPTPVPLVYWVVVAAFAVVVVGLTVVVMDDLKGAERVYVGLLVGASLVAVLFPVMWARNRGGGSA